MFKARQTVSSAEATMIILALRTSPKAEPYGVVWEVAINVVVNNFFCYDNSKMNYQPKKRFFMTNAELKVKPFAERLQLMEDLWETLSNEDNHLQSPAWHQEILEERMNLINTGQAEYVTIEELI